MGIYLNVTGKAENAQAKDKDGNIWIGTANKGLSKVSPGKFRMNRLSVSVNAICEDLNGLVWIGTDAGLLCYDNDVQVENPLTEICKGNRVRHIGLTSKGDILVYVDDDALVNNQCMMEIE